MQRNPCVQLALLGKQGCKKWHVIGVWLSGMRFFLLQKEAWGVWQFREMTFFCVILKSVPLVVWEVQVSVGALRHLLNWCHLLPQPLRFLGTLPSKHSPYLEIAAFGWFLDWSPRWCGRTVFCLFRTGLLLVLISPRFLLLDRNTWMTR